MASIRDYAGEIFLCGSCAQPAFAGENGDEHFKEQWDGVYCPWFPLAGERVVIKFDPMSLDGIKALYPDTYPRDPLPAR